MIKKIYVLLLIFILLNQAAFGQVKTKKLDRNLTPGASGIFLKSTGASRASDAASGFDGSAGNTQIVRGGAGVAISGLINAADAALGAAAGEIWVFGGGSLTTQIVLGSKHTLRFFPGTYTCDAAAGGYDTGVILMKDNSEIVGAGWNTILVERSYQQGNNIERPTIIEAYNGATTVEQPNALTRSAKSYNLRISNLRFKGLRTNAHDSGRGATIFLGNTTNAWVTNCWFDETSAFAAQFGGKTQTGNAAQNVWFTDNLMTGLFSQHVAPINAENVHIERNKFINPGKAAFTITGATNASPIVITTSEANFFTSGMTGVRIAGVAGNTAANGTWAITRLSSTTFSLTGSTGGGAYTSGGTAVGITPQGVVVDLEPNGTPGANGERMRNISVQNNLFDFRRATTNMGGIAYQIVAAGIENENSIISGNVMLGTEIGYAGNLTIGISLPYPPTVGVKISNNLIKRASQAGILAQGTRLEIENNTLVDCGGGNPAIIARDLSYSRIANNHISNPNGGSNAIYEMVSNGANHHNTWENNEAGFIANWTGATVTDSVYRNNYLVAVSGNQGLAENANAARNLYDGNLTKPILIASSQYGLTKVAATSTVISHKYTDGRIFMPKVITSNPVP